MYYYLKCQRRLSSSYPTGSKSTSLKCIERFVSSSSLRVHAYDKSVLQCYNEFKNWVSITLYTTTPCPILRHLSKNRHKPAPELYHRSGIVSNASFPPRPAHPPSPTPILSLIPPFPLRPLTTSPPMIPSPIPPRDTPDFTTAPPPHIITTTTPHTSRTILLLTTTTSTNTTPTNIRIPHLAIPRGQRRGGAP